MNDQTKKQSLAVFEAARAEIVAQGKINKRAVRASCDTLSDFQFAMAWCRFKLELAEQTGHILKPVPKSGGMYRLASTEEAISKSMDTDRLKVVRAARRHLQSLVNLQRRDDLTDETRQVVNREESIRARDSARIERDYLRSQRKRPAGLE